MEISAAAANAVTGNLLDTLEDSFGKGDSMLATLPLFHAFGLLVGIHLPLCIDAPAVLMPVFGAKKVVRAVARNKVTLMIAVPRMVHKLLGEKNFSGKNVRSLRYVYVGGDTVDAPLERAFAMRMQFSETNCKLAPGYGLTETAGVCAVVNTIEAQRRCAASLGVPLVNMRCRVVDENMRELPVGETGELLLAGNQLMNGYLGDEEATREAFCTVDGERWLRTGDLFRIMPDGTLFFMGRKKRLIKISGMNVFPSEIERAAVELPFVERAAVIEVRENDKPYIALFCEGRLNDERVRELKRHIVRTLSHWHEPRYVIEVEALPRTQIGKTDYTRLSDEFEKNRKKSS